MKMKVSNSLETSWEVWEFLKKQGGLDTNYYDLDLIEDLRDRLSFPPSGDFESLLQTKQISTESFLIAFFLAIQPYAEMMVDILRMFERAGANETDRNIIIKFDFDKYLPPLGFDLDHFKTWLDTWQKLKGKYLANTWGYESLWKLNDVLRTREWDPPLQNVQVRRWVSEYRDQHRWPQFNLPAPVSGDPILDEQLETAWRVWQRVVEESSKYGQDRNVLRELTFGRISIADSARLENEEDVQWPVRLLGGIDSDLWASSFAIGAYYRTEALGQLPPSERRKQASELASSLSRIFKNLPTIEVKRDELIQELQAFLQLPIWQKRYEFYSVWIATQLVNALDNTSLRIHHLSGTLIFSFSGTHLATADNFDPRLHIWAELRSPIADPVGKGRKHAIQPDYTLITDPVTSPEASILEVECKQYRRPSKSNFKNALTDYSRGRPNALVVLVNYGRVDESILNGIDINLRNRVYLVGTMRPGSYESQKRFVELVHESIYKRYGSISTSLSQTGLIDLKSTGTINLEWGLKPRDLDLHLHIETGFEIEKINFSNMGSLSEKPWAQLDVDETHGSGSETISLNKWMDGKYHCAVHNYSDDIPLAGCGAHITFACGEYRHEFECPNQGTGKWWSVFILDGSKGQIEITNKIVDQIKEK